VWGTEHPYRRCKMMFVYAIIATFALDGEGQLLTAQPLEECCMVQKILLSENHVARRSYERVSYFLRIDQRVAALGLLFAFDLVRLHDVFVSQLPQFSLRLGVGHGAGVRLAFGGLVAQID
jgi:hypothetical protein